MIPWLQRGGAFPPIESALREPNGLLAAGGQLDARTLLAAYRHGAFPWYAEGQPILWWSPDPRMVLYVRDFKPSRSLRKRVRQGVFEVRVDTAFADVIAACAATPRPGQDGTWITAGMIDAYTGLHELGYGHCVETWEEGRLVGGLYGLCLGGVFFGESMFAHRTDASKVAFASLLALLSRMGVELVDCQQETGHLASLGARPVARRTFARELRRLIHSYDPPAPWPRGPLQDHT